MSSKRYGTSSLSDGLYKAARTTRTLEVLASGNPLRIARRAKNIWIGRQLGPLWRWPR